MRSRTVVLFSVDAGPVPPRRYPARARSRRDILNLAHAAVFMPACFVALTLVASLHLHVAAALPLAVLAAGLLGVLLERVAFRPLRDRSDGNTSGLISSLAMATVFEAVALLVWGPNVARFPIEEQYERFPVLGSRRGQLAGPLSGGEQQMLAFARALLMRPGVLLLDEPSMGLSPILVVRVFEAIQAIHRAGVTLLLVEQNGRLALGISDHGHVLERGRVVLSGASAELALSPRVPASYLGGA